VLEYRYTDGLSEAGAPSSPLPGVAKFDKAGRLVWNQTLFAALAADPNIRRVSISLAGADASGNVVVRVNEIPIDFAAFDSSGLVKLDPDGNVVWAKQISGTIPLTSSTTLSAYAAVSADGSVSMISISPGNANPQTYLDAFDPDGNLGPRVQPNVFSTDFDTVFDSQGKAIVASEGGEHVNVHTIERDTPQCTFQQLPAAPCLQVDAQGAGSCDGPSVVLTASGDLFFGVADKVGVAVLP
jgi:hypothetical protein